MLANEMPSRKVNRMAVFMVGCHNFIAIQKRRQLWLISKS